MNTAVENNNSRSILTTTLISAYKAIRWLWLGLLHVVVYRMGPGKVWITEDLNKTIWWAGTFMTFDVSNRFFSEKSTLSHKEVDRLLLAIREMKDRDYPKAQIWHTWLNKDADRLVWNGLPYQPWVAPVIQLHRYPDDVLLESVVRWLPMN